MELMNIQTRDWLRAPDLPRALIGEFIALALSFTALGAQAQDRAAVARPSRALPTLTFPALSLSGPDARSDDAREFHATALRDLKDSGAFQLLNPGRPAAGSGASAFTFSPVPGTDLMLRFVSHSLARGKLLIEGECINVATGAVIVKKSFLGQTAAVDRMAHRMVDFLVGKVTGTPGVADSSLVFARDTAPGIKEIFEMDRDGRNQRQLTAFGSLTLHPAVSSDGKLAFVTYKGGPPQIWGQVQPKGPYQLLYPKDGRAGMALSGLTWSPDGQRLGFVQGSPKGLADILCLELRSSRVAQLTQGGHTTKSPSWSPDGTTIAYLYDRDGAPQVFLMASDGSHVRRLTSDPSAKACVSWGVKGDRIAYSALSEGQSDLYTLAPDGTGRQMVLSTPEPVESLCWAPDGRSLLLGSLAGKDSHLRIVGLDGTIQALGGSRDGRQFPQWIQNPAPAVAATPGPSSPYPVPALLGAATP